MNQRVVMEAGGFRIESEYDPDLVAALKAIAGRRWDAARRVWTVPLAQAAPLKAIALRYGLSWPQEADKRAAEQAARREALAATSRATAASVDVDLQGFVGELRPYQKAGVAYLLAAKRSIQADDMGLGKTAQALAALEADGAFPALAIAPASLVLNWRSECARWLPHRKVQVVRARRDGLDLSADLVVVSYDLAKRVAPTLATRGFKAVIADEAHYLKNGRSQRTKALANVVSAIPRAHLLTGTPITNRPADLIAPLSMLGHLDREFGGWSAFAKRYCNAHVGRYGWDLSGAAHLDELNHRLRATCLVRRTKDEVLKELPPKQRAFQLTAASDVLVVEQEWVPADLDQAEDRCHRIGQTQCVSAVHLVADRTIDEKLLDVVNRKRAIAERAITGGAVASATDPTQSGSVLGEVLSAYRAKTARPVRRRGIVLAKAA